MWMRFTTALFALALAGIAPSAGSTASRGTNSEAVLFPTLTVSDAAGHRIALLSLEAYRAEFRHLRRIFREIDLKGPAVVTDGWTTNIAEAEWPFMALAYFGYACANLAKLDVAIRDDVRDEMRWLIDALQTPRMSGFVSPHFGKPFASGPLTPSVFVHGHFLSLALRYREVFRGSKIRSVDPSGGRCTKAGI